MQGGRTDGWKSPPNTHVLYPIYWARNSGLIKARSPQRYAEQVPVCLQPFLDPVFTTGQLPLVAGEVHLGLRKKPNFCCIPALSFHWLIDWLIDWLNWSIKAESISSKVRSKTSMPLPAFLYTGKHHRPWVAYTSIQCSSTFIFILTNSTSKTTSSASEDKAESVPRDLNNFLASGWSPAPRKTSVHPSSFQKQGKNPPYVPQLLGCPSQTSS